MADEPAVETEESGGLAAELEQELKAGNLDIGDSGEPETPEDSTSPVESETVEPGGVRSFLKEKFGADLSDKYETDEEALQGLLEASKRLSARDEEASAWRTIQQNPYGFYQQLQQRFGQPAAPQAEPASPQTKSSPDDPGFTYEDIQEWSSQVDRDDAGNIVGLRPGADPSILGRLRQAEKWITKRQQELLFHPEKFLQKQPQQQADPNDPNRSLTVAEWQQLQHQQAWHNDQTGVLNYYSNNPQNLAWLTEDGTNQGRPTLQAQEFAGYLRAAMAPVQQGGMGMQDIRHGIRYAEAELRSNYASRPAPKKNVPVGAQHRPNIATPQSNDGEGYEALQEGESLADALYRQYKDGRISEDLSRYWNE